MCPICNLQVTSLYKDTPYWTCNNCDLWFQDPLPPKKFEAPEEKGVDGRSGGHQQSQHDLDGAAYLARAYARNWIEKTKADGATPKVLDIGCKYPWFAHTLKKEFGYDAYGIDAMDLDSPTEEPIILKYEEELQVPMLFTDFEKTDASYILEKSNGPFNAISMIHVFEHMYEPKAALIKIASLLKPSGYFLIRVPSHEVVGFEYHLSERHYPIHPYYYSMKSLVRLVEESNVFKLIETYPLVKVGARDFILQVL